MKKIKVRFDKTYPDDLIEIVAREECETVRKLSLLINQENFKYVIGLKNNQFFYILISDVFRIYCKNSLVYLKTDKYEYELKERLYEIEKKLNSFKFIKINKSEIINIDKVEKFDLTYSAKIYVYLKNGDISSVSRRNLKKIKTLIGEK